jgi:beta-1,2-mannosidase
MRKIAFLFLIINLLEACSGGKNAVVGDGWMLKNATRADDHNPIMEPDARPEFRCPLRRRKVNWEERNVFNPAATVRDGRVWLLYRAQDERGTSRIGLATSRDGMNFDKRPEPVLHPDEDAMKTYEWEGGCEDPRIVRRSDGLYVMTYTAYDKKTARLCVASSRDLERWEKHGLVLKNTKYRDFWSKSGAIVCAREGNSLEARKVRGKYRMYWGDTDIFMAESDDLLNWTPLEDRKGALLRVMKPRRGMFDSRLVEPGPFAMLRKEGILLLYNSANSASSGDKSLGADVYSVGQALFSKRDPARLIARADQYLLTPERYFEKEGEVVNVCFLEGMVWYKDRWLLYYGAGDSRIAVAECAE